MHETEATVIAVEDGKITVEASVESGCSSCGRNSCSSSILSALIGKRRSVVTVENSLHATYRDRVVIGVEDRDLLTATLLAYLLPLVTMISLALLAKGMAMTETGEIFAAAIGLLLGLLTVRLTLLRGGIARYRPRLLRLSTQQEVVQTIHFSPEIRREK
ncbi:MAG: SoxR reducing system RseC family protein [Gammaproteobacteria bacterium]|nr:SoxR reducing system RseC family protein [Gammaproteobacteria bacterium]